MKLKHSSILASTLIATNILLNSTPILAKQYTPAASSLGEMGCSRTSGADGYKAINGDFVIGREVFTGVARMGGNSIFQSYAGISSRESTDVSCRLAGRREQPRFKTLTLAFGIPDGITFNSKKASSATRMRLSVYGDGKIIGKYNISKGSGQRVPIDVTGVRSLSLSAECVRPGFTNGTCPFLVFFEDTLEE
jgi:hypothetical protein